MAKARATGIGELDRVLGGGLVPGSVTLLGGDPGIGKSTLLIQTLAALSAQQPGLYVSGEESMQQIKLRAMRLSLAADDMNLLAETCVGKCSPAGSLRETKWRRTADRRPRHQRGPARRAARARAHG